MYMGSQCLPLICASVFGWLLAAGLLTVDSLDPGPTGCVAMWGIVVALAAATLTATAIIRHSHHQLTKVHAKLFAAYEKGYDDALEDAAVIHIDSRRRPLTHRGRSRDQRPFHPV